MKRITDFYSKVPPVKQTKLNVVGGEEPDVLKEPEFLESFVQSTSRPPADAPKLPLSSHLTPDVGHTSTLSVDERLKLLENVWVAPEGFKWPWTERKDGEKIRRKYLSQRHFQGDYECFAFSLSHGGVYCKPCALFAPNEVRGMKLGNLVHQPLTKYDLLTGKKGALTAHLKCGYHEDSMQKSQCFKQAMYSGDVSKQLQTTFSLQREKNKDALKRILKAIEFLGRTGMALRGHRDSGQLALGVNTYTEGNFRALLQLMVDCGDVTLQVHIENAKKNATYLSPSSQNNIITAIFHTMRKDIVAEVKHARFFSIMADESSDTGHLEQMSICLRYIGRDEEVKERFLQFEIAPDLSGAALAKQLIDVLHESGIDTKYLVGQAYDGAGNMSGCVNGVQQHILSIIPTAAYVHCVSHSLNLALVKSCTIRELQACKTAMNRTAVFLTESNKRNLILSQTIEELCPEATHERLKRNCATRWVDDQIAVEVFDELYPAVLGALNTIIDARDKASSDATLLLTLITEPGFLVTMQVLLLVLNVTRPLSQALQKKAIDLLSAMKSVDGCIAVLQSYRTDEAIYSKLFHRAEQLYGGEITMPRTAHRQTARNNVPFTNAREYYCRAVFFPFLDNCMLQMRERFQKQHSLSLQLAALIPPMCNDCSFTDIEQGVTLYATFLPCSTAAVEAEFRRWQQHWKRTEGSENDKLMTCTDALHAAELLRTYPAISQLLRIFATLPVTTATCERSFSAMSYLKTYLRTTMTEQRLNGLAHLFVNRDIDLNYDSAIEAFSVSNRRLEF
jgi:hypothetical protein